MAASGPETYDRQLEDVFAIQDAISRSIVDAVRLKVVDDGADLVVQPGNIEAYNLESRPHDDIAGLTTNWA